jgi:hypothetical protein
MCLVKMPDALLDFSVNVDRGILAQLLDIGQEVRLAHIFHLVNNPVQ